MDHINHEDYPLETPTGFPVPAALKRILFNQFVFLGIIGPELMLGMAIVDLRYLSSSFVYLYDRKTRKLIESKKLGLPGTRHIAPYSDDVSAHFRSGPLHIEMHQNDILAESKAISCCVKLDFTDTHPLRLCTRAGYRGWVYTQKTVPVPLSGEIRYGGKQLDISSPSYMAILDWTAGYMRRDTFWNWASAACTFPDGRSFGLNLSCGVNETGFTENAFWLGGKMTKADTVSFVFNPNNLEQQWQIRSQDKKIDLVFWPEARRNENINGLFVVSRFTQLMGTFEGRLITDEGEVVDISACPGWAEDHYAKW